ncbi:MAG: DUF3786 domain-containing protein [Thermodesulfovibrionales bacterium]
MNPLEIYKLLPRTNCGECSQKTCMAFAVYLKTGHEGINECRYLSPSTIERIRSMLNEGDWRDELLRSLKKEIQDLDVIKIGHEIGAVIRDNAIGIRCIGKDYLIDNNGNITPEPYNKWIGILLLHYIRNKGRGDFTGQWVSFSEFKGGLVKASTFQRDCEEPLRELFDVMNERIDQILQRLGGRPVSGFPAERAWMIDLLPRVRLLILYSKGDEEFPSSLKIVFDKVTGNFLDVESIIFLLEGFVHTLRMMAREV